MHNLLLLTSFPLLIFYSNTFNQVSAESANQFGELVADPETNELLHYTEKPETFVSAVLLFVGLFARCNFFG
jgi:hypothetical protein